MNRLLCVCLILGLLCGGLTACKKDSNPQLQSQPQSQPQSDVASQTSSESVESSLDYEDKTSEDETLTAKGCPPLSKDLQTLYADAYTMVRAFNLCAFETDTEDGVEIDGIFCYRVKDQRFATYKDMRTYLGTLFTDDCIDTYLLTNESCVREYNGKVYQINASGTEDAGYAGHVFTVESQTAQQIDLKATAYYTEKAQNRNPFYETPENPDGFTTKDFTFQLVFTDKGWRFSQCPFMQ